MGTFVTNLGAFCLGSFWCDAQIICSTRRWLHRCGRIRSTLRTSSTTGLGDFNSCDFFLEGVQLDKLLFFFNGEVGSVGPIHFNPKFWLKIWIGGTLVQLELFKVWSATSFLFGWLLNKRFGLPHLAFKALYYFVDILQIDCGIWMMDEHNKYTNIVVSMAHFRAFFFFALTLTWFIHWCDVLYI